MADAILCGELLLELLALGTFQLHRQRGLRVFQDHVEVEDRRCQRSDVHLGEDTHHLTAEGRIDVPAIAGIIAELVLDRLYATHPGATVEIVGPCHIEIPVKSSIHDIGLLARLDGRSLERLTDDHANRTQL